MGHRVRVERSGGGSKFDGYRAAAERLTIL
jgi:hypothetical protein